MRSINPGAISFICLVAAACSNKPSVADVERLVLTEIHASGAHCAMNSAVGANNGRPYPMLGVPISRMEAPWDVSSAEYDQQKERYDSVLSEQSGQFRKLEESSDAGQGRVTKFSQTFAGRESEIVRRIAEYGWTMTGYSGTQTHRNYILRYCAIYPSKVRIIDRTIDGNNKKLANVTFQIIYSRTPFALALFPEDSNGLDVNGKPLSVGEGTASMRLLDATGWRVEPSSLRADPPVFYVNR
jgi:hypothetical protein